MKCKLSAALRSLAVWLFSFLLIAPPGVLAETGSSGSPTANLNLLSTLHDVPAGSLNNFHPTSITFGGHAQQITSTTLLTPAQALALTQILNTGHQSLVLNANGSAIAGTAVLHQQDIGAVSTMVIPHGVRVTDMLSNGALHVSGDLTNGGSLLFSGTGQSLAVYANNITNLQGALISTVQPATSLSLYALHNITNAGTITSTSNLSLTAGETIANTGTLQAANTVNLASATGTYINHGSIIASAGDINFASSAIYGATTSLNALNGTLQALQGSINFGDPSYSGPGNLQITGGDFLSNALNLNSGSGTITANVNSVSGVVNVKAGEAQVTSNSPNLQLGVWDVTGDPLIENTGNIDISQTAALSGTEYVILAGGNITSETSNFSINTSIPANSALTSGGNVVLGAGVNFSANTIKGPSSTGGDIQLGNIAGINTSSAKANAPGGSVTLIAFADPYNSLSGGHIMVSGNIVTTGGAGAANGSVTVIGAGDASTTWSVVLGPITTGGGGAAGSGAVNIYTGTPNTGTKGITLGPAGQLNPASLLGGAPARGAVDLSGTITTNGAPVNITASSSNPVLGSSIAIGGAGGINTSSATAAGGAVTLTALGSTNANIIANGDIVTTSSAPGKTGGAVNISTASSITVQSIDTGDLSSSSASNGGNILLTAGGASGGNITFNYLSASGQAGGYVQAVASGNIISAGGTQPANVGPNNIDTSGITGSAGNVNLIAGAQSTAGTSTTITGAATSGGGISITGASGINAAVSPGDTAGNGGNVSLMAYASPTGGYGSVIVQGQIATAGGTASLSSGTSGDVTVLGGGTNSTGSPAATISLPNIITAEGSQAGGGDVTIKTAQPGANVVISNTGAVTSGSFLNSTDANGAVTTGSITTTGANLVATDVTGGNVLISAGANSAASANAILTGAINTTASQVGVGSAQAHADNGGTVTLISAVKGGAGNQDITTGPITTTGFDPGGVAGAAGGAVRVQAGTSINVGPITTGGAASGAGGGSVLLSAGNASSPGNITFTTVTTTGIYGGAVTMIARDNITSTAPGLKIATDGTGSGTNVGFGNGGNVTLFAGALALVGNTTTSVTGSSGTGGSIILSGGSGTFISTTFTDSDTGSNGSGGSVTLAAYANSAQTSGGRVSISGDISTASNITGTEYKDGILNTFSFTGGSGNVLVLAEGPTAANQPTIALNNIVTGNSTSVNGTGSVTLVTASPNTAAGSIVINNSSGSVEFGTLLGGTYRAGAIQVSGNITTNGGDVTLMADSLSGSFGVNVTGAINTSASTSVNANGSYGSNGSGGNVTIITGIAGTASNDASVSIGDTIDTAGFVPPTASGFVAPPFSIGGRVTIMAPGNITLPTSGTSPAIDTGDANTIGSIASAQAGANGGQVLMLAGSSGGSGNITFGSIETLGGSGNVSINHTGNGGAVEIFSVGTSGTISGSSITTDTTNSLGGSAGSVAISSANGSITVTTISAQATAATSSSGSILLSTGESGSPSTPPTVISTSANTSIVSGGTTGSLYAFINNNIATTFTGNEPNQSTVLTGVSSSDIAKLAVGMSVSGSNIQSGTVITAVSPGAGTVTISLATTNTTGTVSGVTFNGGNAQTGLVNITLNPGSESISPSINAVAPQGFDISSAGNVTLAFTAANPSTVKASNTSGAIPMFYSPGGFTSVNTTNTQNLTISGDSRVIVPIISLGATGINLTSTSNVFSSSQPVAFIGNRVTVDGSLNRLSVIEAASAGAISLQSNVNTAQALVLGSVVTASSLTATIAHNIDITAPIFAPTVTLSSVGQGTPGVNAGGFIEYSNPGGNTYNPQIVTNNLVLQASDKVGTVTQPLLLDGSGDAVSFGNSTAGSFALVSNGNVYLNNVSTTTTLISTGNTSSVNTDGNILVVSRSAAGNQGSITASGTINAPYGYIALIAASDITTSGSNVQITASQKDGVGTDPSGGNYIYLLAGANVVLQSSTALVQGRSGLGGDISMPGLVALNTTTDTHPSGGSITVVAYADSQAGLIGGNISLPSDLQIGMYNPSGTGTQTPGQFGVTIAGEASGGPTSATTISVGNVYGGTGSINILAGTPSGSTATPIEFDLNAGSYVDTGRFFTGITQPNASVVTGNLETVGVGSGQNNNPALIGISQQGIFVNVGGALTTNAVTSVGAAGSTPKATNPQGPAPFLPSSLDGYPGGSGGAVFLVANENIVVNGNIYTFGGGGAGGDGAPQKAVGTVQANAPGGAGGAGGAGGFIKVSSNQSITITGSVNASGGGGGGGGGGFGGTASGAGGAGGAGGAAGGITLTAGSIPGASLQVSGPIYAVGGGHGGQGGTGETSGTSNFGGSGGGGGGSYGAGGGGGGAGVIAPQNIGAGIGGAGGGGLFGGGGGDTQNLYNSGHLSQTGYGGWGAGSLLPLVGAGALFGAGVNGGANNAGSSSGGVTFTTTSGFGLGNTGGAGGSYDLATGTLGTNNFAIPLGGTFGNGGAGGESPPGSALTSSGTNGTDAGRGPNLNFAFTNMASDGQIQMAGYSLTTPTSVVGGTILLQAKGQTTASNAGDLTIAGNLVASGNIAGTNQIGIVTPGCSNCIDFAAQQFSTTSGNLLVAPSATINTYAGGVLLENDNSTGHISIGSNAQIFARTRETQFGINISMGAPTWLQSHPIPPVTGTNPTNVTQVLQTNLTTKNLIFFGAAGISASAPQNIIYALGDRTELVNFQSGTSGGNAKSIQLLAGVQIGAMTLPALTSLDLTSSDVGTTLHRYQQENIIGGMPTFQSGPNSTFQLAGGTLTLFPINVTPTVSAFNIPHLSNSLAVTMTNFGVLNPINVALTANSTSQNVVINSPLSFNNSAGVTATPKITFNVTDNQATAFQVNINPQTGLPFTSPTTGTVTSPGTLTLNINSGGSFDIGGNITATQGFTANATGGGNFAMPAGTLTAGVALAGVNITASGITFGSPTTKAVVTDGTSFIAEATDAPGITVNLNSSIAATGGINWTADKGPITLSGALSSSGGQVVLTALSGNGVTINNKAPITGAKGIVIAADGAITDDANLTASAGAVTLSTLASSGGTTTIQANVSGSTGVSISSDGDFSLQKVGTLASTISSAGKTISILAPGLIGLDGLNGKLNAGTGTVVLGPSDNSQPISVGGSASFNVSTANLLSIAAGTVQIGTASENNSITVGMNMNVSGVAVNNTTKLPAYNLSFVSNSSLPTASFSATNFGFTLGTKNLTINVGGSVDPGRITGGTIININGGSISLSAPIAPASATSSLLLTTSGNTGSGNIALNGNLPQTLPATFTASAGGATSSVTGLPISNGTLLFPTSVVNLTLGAGSGGLGSSAITTSAKTLSFNTANISSLITVNESASVNLGASSVGQLTVNDSMNGGTVKTVGTIVAGDLTINMTGTTGGSIAIGSNLTADGTIALNARGAGTITAAAKEVISAGTVTLSSVTTTTSPFGTGAFGSTTANLVVATGSLTATTLGNVYVTDNNRVNLGTSQAASFNLIDTAADSGSTKAITLTGTLSGNSVVLNANNPVSGSIALQGQIQTPLSTAPSTTVTAVTLESAGAGGVSESNTSALVSARTMTVVAGSGGVAMGSANLAPALSVNSPGSVSVEDDSPLVTLGASTGGTIFSLTNTSASASTLTVGGALSAQNISLTAHGGQAGAVNNIVLKAPVDNVAGASAVEFTATGNLTVAGGKIIGNGLLSLDVLGSVGTSSTAPLLTAVSSTSNQGKHSPTGWFQSNTGSSMDMNATSGGALSIINTGNLTGLATTTGINSPISLKTTLTTASIGTSSTAFDTADPNGASLTLSTTGTGLVNVANTGSALTLNASSSGGAFTLITNGPLTVNGVTTHAPTTSITGAGDIKLVAGSGAMAINGNVIGNGGNIIIQNTDTTTGSITFKSAVQVTTKITGVALPTNLSDVEIGIDTGTIPANNPATTPSTLPGGIKLSASSGGKIFTNSTDSSNLVGPGGTASASVQAVGANVLFDVAASGTITLNANVLIKADPVSPGASLAAAHAALLPSTTSGVQAQPALLNNAASAPTSALGPGYTSLLTGTANLSTSNVANQQPTIRANDVFSVIQKQVDSSSDLPALNPENFVLFDGTTIRSMSSDRPVDTTQKSGSDLQLISFHAPAAPQVTGKAPTVVNSLGSHGIDGQMVDNRVTLRKGSVLMVPHHDTVIETRFGEVVVGAGSVVLVVATANALSIYDFHDAHTGAVSASAGSTEIKLAPGRHLTLAASTESFERINPLTSVSHRSLTVAGGSGAVHAYLSEFSIMSALTGLKTWNVLKQSADRHDAQLLNTVLKNAAIMMQVHRTGGGYRRYAPMVDKVASNSL